MKTLVNRTLANALASDPLVILPFVSGPKADTHYKWDPRLPNLLEGPYRPGVNEGSRGPQLLSDVGNVSRTRLIAALFSPDGPRQLR